MLKKTEYLERKTAPSKEKVADPLEPALLRLAMLEKRMDRVERGMYDVSRHLNKNPQSDRLLPYAIVIVFALVMAGAIIVSHTALYHEENMLNQLLNSHGPTSDWESTIGTPGETGPQ